jgi:hypothetical protein
VVQLLSVTRPAGAAPNPASYSHIANGMNNLNRFAVLAIIFGVWAMAYDTGRQQPAYSHHACQQQLKP